jgi:hypothetical protein
VLPTPKPQPGAACPIPARVDLKCPFGRGRRGSGAPNFLKIGVAAVIARTTFRRLGTEPRRQ